MSLLPCPGNQAGLWIFGYGSLMWRPGFDYCERAPATLYGFHRSLCIHSHVHRGTPERPGLVLGLDRGGACRGAAFRVEPARAETVLGYLREREMATAVYKEAIARVRLGDGRRVAATAYVTDTAHAQYAGRLPRGELLRLVMQGEGISGPNHLYIENTQRHLAEQGIRDPVLEWLCAALKAAGPARPEAFPGA